MQPNRVFNDPVVVTGGAGFLGSEVIRQLRNGGCEDIRVVDIAPLASPAPQGLRSFRLDIRTGNMAEAFRGARTVLHLAACQYHSPLAPSTYRLPFFEVNCDGTRRVLQASLEAGVRRFVHVSTNMVYGIPRHLPLTEEHATHPFGPYGQSKLKGEQLVRDAHGSRMTSGIVRPGLIVGKGRTGVIQRVFDWVLSGVPVFLIGNGSNRYEMMASEDVAGLTIATAGDDGFDAYNCAAASVPTMREWIHEVIGLARSRSRIVSVPGRPLKAVLRALERLQLSPLRMDQYLIADRDYHMSAELAEKRLGWKPIWRGEDAIVDTFRWYVGTLPESKRPRLV